MQAVYLGGDLRKHQESETGKTRKAIKGTGYHCGQLGLSTTGDPLADCVEHTSKLHHSAVFVTSLSRAIPRTLTLQHCQPALFEG